LDGVFNARVSNFPIKIVVIMKKRFIRITEDIKQINEQSTNSSHIKKPTNTRGITGTGDQLFLEYIVINRKTSISVHGTEVHRSLGVDSVGVGTCEEACSSVMMKINIGRQ
jgi:hypothetical protein